MSAINSDSTHNEKPVPINMRADASKRNLIDIAARLAGRDHQGGEE